MLFNSYYHGVGERFPRPHRGLLTRPSLDEIRAYREQVDSRMRALLTCHTEGRSTTGGTTPPWQDLVILGLHHEQQHQELLLTDIKHLFSCNPLWPAYRSEALPSASIESPLTWLAVEGGLVEMGHAGSSFSFDNETPRHRVYLAPYELASRLVSNGEFSRFVEAGGYEQSSHWLAEGWDWRVANNLHHPMYWQRSTAGAWNEFTLNGLKPLAVSSPVIHLSYYEADAYARWAGARLPTEAEWEHAAEIFEASRRPANQWFGSAWQWTQSSYAPYPGFRPAEGAVGEYNGKFMVNQYVLRGSSCATPAGHERLSYRNFFPATARWQFSGLRLARD